MHDIINSEQNSKIKYLKKLYDRRKRRDEGKFILEGYRIIEEALKAQARIDNVFMTPDFLKSKQGEDLKIKINNMKDQVSITVISEKLLEKIADTSSPQGVIALANEKKYDLESLFDRAKRLLLIDRVQDPGNMGTIIRTAVAAGIDGILILKGSVDIYNLKVLRSTMGAIFNISIIKDLSLDDFFSFYNSNKNEFKLISTALNTEKYYYDIEYPDNLIIAIGNEANGLKDEIIKNSDYIVKIPIIGEIDSLNAAIATGIIVYKALEANC
ncbi:TrmH family RNA methyltransferase [Natronospora cellulosivora (SeqCode)]